MVSTPMPKSIWQSTAMGIANKKNKAAKKPRGDLMFIYPVLASVYAKS
jgi:hypothetical protein